MGVCVGVRGCVCVHALRAQPLESFSLKMETMIGQSPTGKIGLYLYLYLYLYLSVSVSLYLCIRVSASLCHLRLYAYPYLIYICAYTYA